MKRPPYTQIQAQNNFFYFLFFKIFFGLVKNFWKLLPWFFFGGLFGGGELGPPGVNFPIQKVFFFLFHLAIFPTIWKNKKTQPLIQKPQQTPGGGCRKKNRPPVVFLGGFKRKKNWK